MSRLLEIPFRYKLFSYKIIVTYFIGQDESDVLKIVEQFRWIVNI